MTSSGFNENGLLVPIDSEVCLAKKIYQEDVKKVAYYISINDLNGQPYDPQALERFELKFKMVSKHAFDSYLNFLTTRDIGWFNKTTNYVLEGFNG